MCIVNAGNLWSKGVGWGMRLWHLKIRKFIPAVSDTRFVYLTRKTLSLTSSNMLLCTIYKQYLCYV
jgi:hypothetical protein